MTHSSAPVRSIAALAKYVNGYPFKPEQLGDEGYPVVRIRQLVDPTAESDHHAGDLPAKYRLSDGDLVFSWSGSLAVREWARGDAYLNQHLFRVEPVADVDKRWLKHVLEYSIDQFESLRNGSAGMSHINLPTMKQVSVPTPGIEEQRRIADFLDDQVARIDASIKCREREMGLVDSLFDSHLREVVLGSGSQSVGWAGHVGDDRRLLRLGSLVQIRGEKNDPVRVTQVLSLTAKRGVIPYEEKGDIGNKASDDISRYSIVRRGDIVVNSMNVIIGSVGISSMDGVLSPVYYVLKSLPNSPASSEFVALHFRIREFQAQLVRLGYGILAHRMRIPWINLKTELLAIPPASEQERIVVSMTDLDMRRKRSLELVESAIEGLQEFKRSLITAAVTGELDVTTARRGVPA